MLRRVCDKSDAVFSSPPNTSMNGCISSILVRFHTVGLLIALKFSIFYEIFCNFGGYFHSYHI